MLFYPRPDRRSTSCSSRSSPSVQYVFTLGMALAVAAVNVFFRDLGNVLRHVLRLWFYLSPGLYSLSRARASTTFIEKYPILAARSPGQSVRDPVRVVPRRHLRNAGRLGRTLPELGRAGRAARRRASSCSASATIALQAPRAVVREGPVMAGARHRRSVPGTRTRSRSRDLGVRYSLRFTQKTTLRQSIAQVVLARTGRARSGRCATCRSRCVHGESLARHRAERRRQEHAPPGPGRDHHAVGGRGRRARPRVEPADARRRLRPGAHGQREHPARRRVPGPRRQDGPRAAARSIVEFADLGQFIDAPIKTYSSGMRARLGFAIATSVDPDILLLDEVLATGDADFRAKSKQRVIELVKAAKGDRARDPRHGLGDGVLQPGDAAREGPASSSRASRPRSSASTRSTRRGARPRNRRSSGSVAAAAGPLAR